MTSTTARRMGAVVALILAVAVIAGPRVGAHVPSETRAVAVAITDAPVVAVAASGNARPTTAVLLGLVGVLGWIASFLWVACTNVVPASTVSSRAERRWRARKVGAPPVGAC